MAALEATHSHNNNNMGDVGADVMNMAEVVNIAEVAEVKCYMKLT